MFSLNSTLRGTLITQFGLQPDIIGQIVIHHKKEMNIWWNKVKEDFLLVPFLETPFLNKDIETMVFIQSIEQIL